MIGAAVAMAAVASMAAAPAAHATCEEEYCYAPSNDPGSALLCVVTYDGPIKGIASCFEPRP